jgi:hypothetical protein
VSNYMLDNEKMLPCHSERILLRVPNNISSGTSSKFLSE